MAGTTRRSTTDGAAEPAAKSLTDQIAEEASQNTLALNPLVGMRSEDLLSAAGTVISALASHPQVVAQSWVGFMGEMGRILTGKSDIGADAKDKRFAHPAWSESALHRGLMQSYTAWAKAVTDAVGKTELSDKDSARARLVTSIFVDAMAPSNNLIANPLALKQAVDTKGQSLVEGFKNFIGDMTKNGGLPSQVDMTKFKVGENLANTPGTVVFRNDVLELILYTPTTEKVFKRPLLIVPPQINKYYAVDMSPSKSMIRFLLSQGIQPFCISWRNPTEKQRDWGLDTYIAALDEAVDAALEITGSKSLNVMGSCSGGITVSTYAGWLAGQGLTKLNGIILAVCVIDTEASTDTDFAALVTPESVLAAKQMSAMRGVLDGQDMAKMFAWMRPNDLIWNYWVNNYLMGNQPPAFDILYWNADTTRLPARLHGDFLDLIFTNPFVNAGKMVIHGTPIDMGKVKADTYVIGGTTDHITPWKAVYQTARIYGPETTFVLSNSGHLQSLLNPPGNPKAWYVTAKAKPADADQWAATGKKHEGSWWTDWAAWIKERGDKQVAAPKAAGSKKHPPLGAAPGTYVFEP
ncbi:alpha/beta fold hydrolase [Phreatobacter aquaticus]|uniref:Alpha/beta fold hydrolase n=1 Tax=Phreatobacter aquaticus TaxID=2570229 RepID=A0A4D7QCX8_9HYPH|nr:alpha/beta fold hydrolase [Phreatobacter aquaticus]QCK84385.1 alpha/beta fold hydrolase [Phreatobacter aquaticus]